MGIDLYGWIGIAIVVMFVMLVANMAASRLHTLRRQRAEERHFNGWDRKGDVA